MGLVRFSPPPKRYLVARGGPTDLTSTSRAILCTSRVRRDFLTLPRCHLLATICFGQPPDAFFSQAQRKPGWGAEFLGHCVLIAWPMADPYLTSYVSQPLLLLPPSSLKIPVVSVRCPLDEGTLTISPGDLNGKADTCPHISLCSRGEGEQWNCPHFDTSDSVTQ